MIAIKLLRALPSCDGGEAGGAGLILIRWQRYVGTRRGRGWRRGERGVVCNGERAQDIGKGGRREREGSDPLAYTSAKSKMVVNT